MRRLDNTDRLSSQTLVDPLAPRESHVGIEPARSGCIHAWIEAQVARTPEAVAVGFEGEFLTYRELNARANQLAHHLRRLGVGPEGLVGLYAERSLNLIVGMLATLKAGGAYVPIDPAFTRERLGLMLEDARPLVLLTQKSLATHALPAHVRVFQMDADWSCVADESVENPDGETGPANAAYVIFTSGSTGRPKGVVVEHRQLVNYVTGIIQSLTLPPGLRFATVSTFAADLGHTVIFPSLVTGGQLHVIAEERAADPNKLADYFHREAIEVLKIVPSHLMALLQSAPPGKAAHCLPRRILVLGGEASDWGLIGQVRELAPACRIFNHYGPTETTVGVLVNDLQQPASTPSPATVPLGHVLPSTHVYIVDPQLNPVAVGEPGELLIGGAGVARGYLNRPDLTAERFIPDPFSGDQAARLYRTGDRVRALADGTIEFLGRLDHQVKIRGYRIELGEIEAVLGGHPDLSACVVVPQTRGGGDKILAAFVVGRDSTDLSGGSLRQWLSQKLPDYMIPSRFFVLPSLPLTTNGKVDRKALENLEAVELAAGTEYVPPRSELECQLVEIWQTVLRPERLGIHDNFFDLGGHSLLALTIGSQITRQLHVEVPMRWMFEHPTIERLAQHMEAQKGLSLGNRPIEKADRQAPLPMSFAQQRMWLLQQTLPDPAAYNQPAAFRLAGRVDRDRARRALQVIMERHEILRTALWQTEEELVQQVNSAQEVPLPWLEVDLQAVPPNERESALAERLSDEARRPFDLAQAPLWRAVWIQMTEDEQVLAVTCHHSIVDEWSWRLFFQEWERLYAADGRVELAGLPDLPVQYADFAEWQRQRLTGELLEQQRRYWAEQLVELPPALELPTDLARPARPSGKGALHEFSLTGPAVTRLRGLAREERTTLFTVLLAAFQVWLHRYTGQTDLIVGTPVANRERPEVQSLLGFFLNTLPIRARLDGTPTFRQVLRQVRESLLGAFSHADLPFEQMVQMAGKERAPGHQPLYQVMFVLLEEGRTAFQWDEAKARPLVVETRTSKNDLTLSIEAVGDTCACRFEYATDLFTAETAARMGRHLTELLQSIADDPEKAIHELNLMPAAERNQVLVEWNQTERDYPRDQCIHQLFEEQAERTPEAVAVVFEGQSLPYRELNARANRLAHHLRSVGVGPDVLVGLCVERSLELVVALLGILKAGGVYVPMDAASPPDRLASILQESGSSIVLAGSDRVDWFARAGTPFVSLEKGGFSEGDATGVGLNRGGDDLAYVIFTSGSTGKPKGVAVPHRAIARLVINSDYARLTPDDVVAHVSNVGFDAATFEIWGALLNGAKLMIVPQDVLLSTSEFAALLAESGVTTLFLTTALFNQVARQNPGAFRPLKHLLFGGEACNPDCVRHVLDHGAPQRLLHVYGPTETTTFASWHLVREVPADALTVPIGQSIANTTIHVLDSGLQLVPCGVIGEIFIGGPGVAIGYLNDSGLTAERFLETQFGRLYRTGDLARRRTDGAIEFYGRIDSQVKLRGFRIEPGEIESALREHPAVKESLVDVREHAPGEKRLVAYVSCREESPTADELRTFLKDALPDYMIPSAFVFLDALPLTPNGKIDRRALPAPDFALHHREGEFVPPASPLEERLVQIWSEVIGVPNIGVHDDFFALGGHSLLAAKVVSELQRTLGVKVPLATLFLHPTIEALARAIAAGPEIGTGGLVQLKSGSAPRKLILIVCEFGTQLLRLGPLLHHETPLFATNLPLPHAFIEAAVVGDKNLPSLEELAAPHVAQILAHHPGGPCVLAGYCVEGVLAIEVARQLQARGVPVESILIFDSMFIPTALGWRFAFHRFRLWAHRNLKHATRLGPGYLWNKIVSRLRRRPDAPAPTPEPSRTPRDAADEAAHATHMAMARKIYLHAQRTYRPQRIPGRGVLFLSTDSVEYADNPGLAARVAFGADLEVVPVSGGHLSMLEDPHLGNLAAEISKALCALDR